MLLEDSMMTTLHISDISPHQDNPRKDLGDLEELTESIEKNGIMQNLTVVPVDEDNPVKYICLIGHRRLAAAKKAGVYSVPARIVFGLTHRDQVGIMLEENMQRNDLTIVEQAQGFQMMLDLGETEESIAEKTGFSRTTVRHRLQLAKLDQKELKRRQDDEGFQLSLKDLYALEKVKDINKRNEILKGAFSSNEIRRQAENAERDEKREQTAAAIMEKLKPFGIKKIPKSETNWKWSGKYDILKEIVLDNPGEEINIELEEGETPYAAIQYGSLYVCVHKRKTPKQIQSDEREKELNRRKKAFKELCKSKYEDRRMFIEGIAIGTYKPYANDYAMVENKCWEYAFNHYTSIDKSGTWEFLKGTSWWDLKTDEDKQAAVRELLGINKTALLVISCARAAGDGSGMIGWSGKLDKDSSYLDEQRRIYEILKLYGYQPDEEEKQMLDGTHELYTKEE